MLYDAYYLKLRTDKVKGFNSIIELVELALCLLKLYCTLYNSRF